MDITDRIARGKSAFKNKNHLLTVNGIEHEDIFVVENTRMECDGLYSCETWRVSEIENKELEAFEILCY